MTNIFRDMLEDQRAAAKDGRDHREEYRREIAQHVEPLMEAARNTDKQAVEIALSVFKTSNLLNGGAIVAIPAVVTLFGLDAKAVADPLLIAGGIFAGGLISSWLSAVFGFFALSNRADRDYWDATSMKLRTNIAYYPPADSEDGKNERTKIENEITQANDKRSSFQKAFVWCTVARVSETKI
jgi:hypothetical protein